MYLVLSFQVIVAYIELFILDGGITSLFLTNKVDRVTASCSTDIYSTTVRSHPPSDRRYSFYSDSSLSTKKKKKLITSKYLIIKREN